LCDGFSAISDDKPIDLAARLEERCKLLIERNQPVSGFTLCLADDWPVPTKEPYEWKRCNS
ncbi:MAG: hypothetical protein MR637_12350, partial [Clostridiales bacterium]|nr:hypothetical protein [Clostridiales bacterium]